MVVRNDRKLVTLLSEFVATDLIGRLESNSLATSTRRSFRDAFDTSGDGDIIGGQLNDFRRTFHARFVAAPGIE